MQINRGDSRLAVTLERLERLEHQQKLGARVLVEAREPVAQRTTVNVLLAHFGCPPEERRDVRGGVANANLLSIEQEQNRNRDRSRRHAGRERRQLGLFNGRKPRRSTLYARALSEIR